ncbi:hypothetical protein BZA70DRAFT_41642 [Myxozyma melibiosi]|uniref:Secreted protein n=1 Tax=Myxozyma melibiosi TaxID=54550 RepID=A0ABR1FEG9_9ASCO
MDVRQIRQPLLLLLFMVFGYAEAETGTVNKTKVRRLRSLRDSRPAAERASGSPTARDKKVNCVDDWVYNLHRKQPSAGDDARRQCTNGEEP